MLLDQLEFRTTYVVEEKHGFYDDVLRRTGTRILREPHSLSHKIQIVDWMGMYKTLKSIAPGEAKNCCEPLTKYDSRLVL